MKADIKILNFNNKFSYEIGHTLEEWEAKFGGDEEFWEILKEELEDGTLEPTDNVYWLIGDRYYETDIPSHKCLTECYKTFNEAYMQSVVLLKPYIGDGVLDLSQSEAKAYGYDAETDEIWEKKIVAIKVVGGEIWMYLDSIASTYEMSYNVSDVKWDVINEGEAGEHFVPLQSGNVFSVFTLYSVLENI